MEIIIEKIGFGGGCHWCTEAVFQSLIGVDKVDQGYAASNDENASFSEAVIVHFNPNEISLNILIDVHLNTHKSTLDHSMRDKYRSAIYTFSETQYEICTAILNAFQAVSKTRLVTKVLPFKTFTPSREAIQNYYQKNPEKPFCQTYISPKLNILRKTHSEYLKQKYTSISV